MKKLFAITLALGMILALTACAAPIKLVTTTANGILIDVPSDFGAFADKNGSMIATNSDGTASISVAAVGDGGGLTPADIDQDTYQQQAYPNNSDVEFVAFDNAADCNGIPAVSAICKFKNSSDVDVTAYSYVLFFEDGTIQGISVNYNTDNKSSAKDDIDAIVKSIKAE